MHSAGVADIDSPGPSAQDPWARGIAEPVAPAALTWDQILAQLTTKVPELVEDFLVEFRAQEPYPEDQVPDQDVFDTAYMTFDLLIRRLRGEPDPPAAAGAMERLAARRAQQGVPMSTFLRAVRTDFRILWSRLQMIAGDPGSAVLAENVIQLLDTVDRYVDALREAYRAEEARMDRTTAAQRQRTILRLFSDEQLARADYELLASRLGMPVDGTFEVIAVTGESMQAIIASYGNDPAVAIHESVSSLIAFRPQLAADRWRRDTHAVGGYVGSVAGLHAVPAAARVALHIARNAPAQPKRLATEDEVWPTVALLHLRTVFPEYACAVHTALGQLPQHDRDRMVEAVRLFLATGSVKDTAEQLFCHRNTVINRLKAFAELTGFDPTLPSQAAWVVVALAAIPGE